MENQAVKRRISTISAHFATGIAPEEVTAATTQLFPLNCSSTSFRRFDNKMQFGRQASSALGYFMRPSSIEQDCSSQRPRVCSACYGKEKKSIEGAPPLFSRPVADEPWFSRPAEMEFNSSNIGTIKSPAQSKMSSSLECPKFTSPGGAASKENQFSFGKQMLPSQNKGSEWSPRINVAECKSNHVITVELPGVNIEDIRAEMDDKNIIVKGKRSMKWWKAVGCSNDSFATYHMKEIPQGPYQVVWPLPPGANKDAVSAEFVEGILQITIPKL